MTKHLKVFDFFAVNPEACFLLYSISYLLDENCTKNLSKETEAKERKKLFLTKVICQLKLERSHNVEMFVVTFKLAAKYLYFVLQNIPSESNRSF